MHYVAPSMSLSDIIQQFLDGMRQTTLPEYIAVLAGIASVWFSRVENIWVYPTGLVNTLIYIYISLKFHLIGEASVNLYYSIMSVYGWILWTRKNEQKEILLKIRFSTGREWLQQIAFFACFYIGIFLALTWLKRDFAPEAIPWGDAFASATAYTGMWLMARKKVESWYWWIATNIAAIPLYFVKDLVFTSVYYLILLVLAIGGLMEWKKRARVIS